MMDRQGGDTVEITPQMIEAGVIQLGEQLQAGTGSAYVVSEVFRAMMLRYHRPPQDEVVSGEKTKDC